MASFLPPFEETFAGLRTYLEASADWLSFLADPTANSMLDIPNFVIALVGLAVAIISLEVTLPNGIVSEIRSAAVVVRPLLVLAAATIILVALGVVLGLWIFSSVQGGEDNPTDLVTRTTPESPPVTPTILATAAATAAEATRQPSPTPEPTPRLDWVSIEHVDPRPPIVGEDVTFTAEVGTNLDTLVDFCFKWRIDRSIISSDNCARRVWKTTAPSVVGPYTVTVSVSHAQANLESSAFEFITVKNPGN